MPESLAQEVLNEAAKFTPRETGGVLLGFHEDESRSLVATDLIGAGPSARREWGRFVPDGPWQRARIAERYQASGRTLAYLGDWHSHPDGNGPSDLDRSTAQKIASAPAARCPHPIFLIVTRGTTDWELRAYRFGGRQLRVMGVRIH